MFPKAQDNVLECLVLSTTHKDIQFTVIEEERNQKIFTFKKLELKNLGFSFFKKYSNQSIVYQNSGEDGVQIKFIENKEY